jgi:hypothetical protein
MRLNTAVARLGVHDDTVRNWRKKLGIFEKTRHEVTPKQFEELRRLRDSRQKYTRRGEKLEGSELNAGLEPNSDKLLEFRDDDAAEIRNLKQQYNQNIAKIDYVENLLQTQMGQGLTPEKYLMDSSEKCQRLNISIAAALRKLSPVENELEMAINERLSSY